MAPEPVRFVFAVTMALAILAGMTSAVAAPAIYPIYQPQLLLVY